MHTVAHRCDGSNVLHLRCAGAGSTTSFTYQGRLTDAGVPMLPELAEELRLYMPKPVKKGNVRFIVNRDLIFPPKAEAKGTRRRVESSFEDLLVRAEIEDFRFHDLRHTFASWYMMNGGDLYELAKILGHSNIKMTERYAKLARQHIARTSSTAREMWKLLEPTCDKANAA